MTRTEMPPHAFNGESEQPLEPRHDAVTEQEIEPYYGRNAFLASYELFGEHWERPGVMYSAYGSSEDVPFRIVSSGGGHIETFNMLGGKDVPAAGQGLDGYLISRQEAEAMAASEVRNQVLGLHSPDNRADRRSDTDE